MAVTKEYNIRRQYETKHQDKYKDLDMKQKLQKVEEMERKSSFTADNVHKSKITK